MRSGPQIIRLLTATIGFATVVVSKAATLSIQSDGPESLELHLSADPLSYFYLQQSTDMVDFTPFSMVLGNQVNFWPLFNEDLPTRFFRFREISLFAPEDTDGDGIDDVYELRHPILNPLDPTDAALISPGSGLTYLQEYRANFGFSSNPPEVYSREVSSFNFGGNFDRAISREFSIFNFGSPLESAISREIGVFNFGPPLHAVDAASREISVFNGDVAPSSEFNETFSREITLFNFGASLSTVDISSREISTFNGDSVPASDLAVIHSREVSLFNFSAPTSRIEAVSREVSVKNSAN